MIEQLRLQNFSKHYGPVRANDQVNFAIHQGEIKALLGENGAGKSTLVKMICGVVQCDSGQLFWQGQAKRIDNPKDAQKLGIGMVFQHFSLFDSLTVLDNIALGLTDRYQKSSLQSKIENLAEHYGLTINCQARVADLSVGAKQRIEIIRALLQSPQLLILDEPTAVLTPQEADKLFVTLRQLAAEGCAILYISHRLEEICNLCHQATIMRSGRVVAEINPRQKTIQQIAELMLGDAIIPLGRNSTLTQQNNPPILRVQGLNLPVSERTMALHNINFTLHQGEIIGIGGIAGNGQNELLAVLSGEERCREADEVMFAVEGANKPIGHKTVVERRELGIGISYVPEERLGHGAVAEMSLAENVLLTAIKKQGLINRLGLIQQKHLVQSTAEIIRQFDVKAESVHALAASLSGGNLQKFIVGREIAQAPRIMLAAQPTWGVDAGAAARIQQALLDLAAQGCAILLISQDLDELFNISHRIGMLFEGRLSALYPNATINREEVGLLMVGERLPSDKLTDVTTGQNQQGGHPSCCA